MDLSWLQELWINSEAYLSVADRCFATWGHSSLMEVQLALNCYQVTVAASTSNWSSFLNCESAPKLQFANCPSTLVLWLKVGSVSPRETWMTEIVVYKVKLIPFRIRDVVLACFLPFLTGWSDSSALYCTMPSCLCSSVQKSMQSKNNTFDCYASSQWLLRGRWFDIKIHFETCQQGGMMSARTGALQPSLCNWS